MDKYYQSLIAEKNTLEKLIADTAEDEVIDLMSLQARLANINQKLKEMPEKFPEPARIKLTFRGKPVIKSHGIFAEFGTDIIAKFIDVITKLMPEKSSDKMLITSTAQGSFGFILEEYLSPENSNKSSQALAHAINQSQLVFEALLKSDDELADITEGMDKKTISAVKSFLDKLANEEAVCTFNFKEKVFKFDHIAQVKSCSERLSITNIKEDENISIFGEFLGLLPNKRTFEFKIKGSNELITGKISPSILNPEKINSIINHEIEIKVTKTTVGRGKPRYLIIEIPSILN
ncbi:MAG: hypothetical protein DCC88_12225 [Spirobacillus cienkowskii]|jgi:hypothetical protein|uniref:Uncharacterized protein n=1 Tax=Spirobacillus cienkowskii TaxID=495820 RepID=A0A369KK92_9BACT|nr:MAG: hypothetical protein DCC88_12225 [Spirobacillus cienkowskii]